MFALLVKVIPVDFGSGFVVDRSDEEWSLDPTIRAAQVIFFTDITISHCNQNMNFFLDRMELRCCTGRNFPTAGVTGARRVRPRTVRR